MTDPISLANQRQPAQSFARFDSYWMVGVLTLFYVFEYIDRLIMAILVGPIKAQLHFTDVAVSLLLGPAVALPYAVAALPFGWAADRYSRRTIIFIGVVIWSISTSACGLAHSFDGIFFARMGVGVGQSALIPATYSLIADKIPKGRLTTAMSVFSMGPHIGIALAFALGGVLIQLADSLTTTGALAGYGLQSWQLVFLLAGTPGFLVALLAYTFSEPTRSNLSPRSAAEEGRIVPFLREHWALLSLLLLGFGSMTVIGGAVPLWVPAFMERHFHETARDYGAPLGAVTLIGTSTLFLTGMLADTSYRRGVKDASVRCYTWLLIGFIPIGWTLFFSSSAAVFLLGYVAVLAVALSFMVFLSATIARITPPWLRGQLTALFLFAASIIGLGISPTVVAVLTDYVFNDPQKLGYSLAIVTGGGSLVALICLRSSLGMVRRRVEDMEAEMAT